MTDHPFRRRHFFKVMGATSAAAATAAAHGAEPPRSSGPSQNRAEQAARTKSDRTEREEHGMSAGALSKARLDRMHDVLAGHVERGELPGLVTLIRRRAEVHVDAIGMKAVGGNEPMRRDTIFRIASMSKPITSVAAMILMEECKLRLDEPVDRLLPELADRKVLKRLDASLDDTVPSNRPISVRDLLTFRMGLGIIMPPPDTYPIQKAIAKLEIGGMGPPNPSSPHSPDEWIRRVATLPLVHQPGEKWMYNLVCVVTHRDGPAATPGQYGWNGGLGTSWSVDPAEGMVAMVLTQRSFTSPIPPEVILDFWTSAYQAIDD
jgi:CubicO group peptidase (beta-lactamase class C family)